MEEFDDDYQPQTQEIDQDEESDEEPSGVAGKRPWGKLTSIEHGPCNLKSIELFGDNFVIGRTPNSSFFIDDMEVSRQHVTIKRLRRSVFVQDHSVNGSALNNAKMNKNQNFQLCGGDVLSLVCKSSQVSNSTMPSGSQISQSAYKYNLLFQTYIHEIPKMPGFEDKYLVKEKLGEGTFGTVYKVMRVEDDEVFAVKILRKGEEQNEASFQNIFQEMELLRRLDHPGIVTCKDHYCSEDMHHRFVVMEYLSGGTLLERIQPNPGIYCEQKAKKLIKNIIDAVDYLHSQGIAHRDLKLENILLVKPDDDTMVKLVDFGTAKQITEGLKTFCGTPMYMAPEVIKSNSPNPSKTRYTNAADMWSIGVITYMVLLSEVPFKVNENSLTEPSVDQLKTRSNFKALSAPARDFILNLLKDDPESRMSSKEALQHEWLSFSRFPSFDSYTDAETDDYDINSSFRTY